MGYYSHVEAVTNPDSETQSGKEIHPMASRTASPLPSELGAFARKALRDLEPEGFRFVGLAAGVVIIEHPEYGRFEMTNDSYSSLAVGPRRGLYADAVINDVCQIDDGEFELHLASIAGAPVETVP